MLFTYKTTAMNSDLLLSLDSDRESYAHSAALDLFDELKRLEELLSMYVLGSDVHRINSLPVGETLKILDVTAEALGAAVYVSHLTKGALDITLGEYFLSAKNKEKIENPRQAKITIFPDDLIVKKEAAGKIDLGAIGKGFALDILAEKLVNVWGIESALFNFGSSSILALNPPKNESAWGFTFAGKNVEGFELKNVSVGASGTAVQGNHIIDCRTREVPKDMPCRAWAIGQSAVLCDAFSTAFMLISREEIAEICKKENMRAVLQMREDSELEFIG